MTGGVYYLPLSKQKIIKKFLDKKDKFNVSNFFCDKHFCPPCYPELSVKDVNYICDFLLKIKKLLNSRVNFPSFFNYFFFIKSIFINISHVLFMIFTNYS